jgi:hypothetical protein
MSITKYWLLVATSKAINPIMVLVAALMAIYIRGPQFLEKPRIWAEEGSVYLLNALENQPLASFLTPHLGYYSLFNKIAIFFSVAAFPLKYAAMVTTAFSVALQVWTCLIIYSSVGRLAKNKIHRYFLAFLPILFATPETWLNTINGQFWLATGVYFILNSESLAKSQILYLSLAFMTGVSSLFFLPYFMLRTAIEKTRALITISAIGAAAAMIQFSSLFHTQVGGAGRFKLEYLANAPFGFLKTITPFHKPLPSLIFAIFIVIAVFVHATTLLKFKDKIGIVYTIVSLLTYTLLSVLASVSMIGGGRYGMPVYCGLVAIALSNLWLAKRLRNSKLYLVCMVILVASEVLTFFDLNTVYSENWPNWYQQVQTRRCDQDSEILIFPQWRGAQWKIALPRDSGIECRRASASM